MQNLEPELKPVAITDLRPTQMTIGKREVARKRAEWAKRAGKDGADFLGSHMIPAVIGPKRRMFIIDHHHLVRALHEEGVEHVLINVVADLSKLAKPLFWTFMDNRNWLHPYDATGTRVAHDKIPKSIAKLPDDPYRSLAGAVREAGGCAKDATPYAEFLWADFLRHRVAAKLVGEDFAGALTAAVDLARSKDAAYLPGWSGPSGD